MNGERLISFFPTFNFFTFSCVASDIYYNVEELIASILVLSVHSGFFFLNYLFMLGIGRGAERVLRDSMLST